MRQNCRVSSSVAGTENIKGLDFNIESLRSRIGEMLNQDITDSDYARKYNLKDNRDWQLENARNKIQQLDNWENNLTTCLYRPFDWRYSYFSEIAMDYPRRKLIDNVFLHNNICLLVPRQISTISWQHLSVSNVVAESCVVSAKTKEQNYNFPLYQYSNDGSCTPNLAPDFVADLAARLSLHFVPDDTSDLAATFGPEDVFHYIYAVLHSPTYRSRYADFLKRDFPRVPLTASRPRFRRLAALGTELVDYHLLRREADFITTFSEAGDCAVAKGYPRFVADDDGERGRVYINPTQYFGGVPAAVWEFHIGGYQVCRKWLWDRRGRALDVDDLNHYQAVVVALDATIRLMAEVDAAIDKWPLE